MSNELIEIITAKLNLQKNQQKLTKINNCHSVIKSKKQQYKKNSP